MVFYVYMSHLLVRDEERKAFIHVMRLWISCAWAPRSPDLFGSDDKRAKGYAYGFSHQVFSVSASFR